MIPSEKAEFSKLLSGVAELYGKGISVPLLELYWCALDKYDFTDVRHAIGQHTVNPDVGQFMPKPADVVRYIEGKSQEKALFAWQKVVNAMKTVGAYQSIRFDDHLIHHIIDEMGGWVTLCHSDESKLPFIYQDFSRRYTAYLHYPPHQCPKQLTGILEHQNRLYGGYVPEVISFDDNSTLSNISYPAKTTQPTPLLPDTLKSKKESVL